MARLEDLAVEEQKATADQEHAALPKSSAASGVHVAFCFNRTANYPPNSQDMKAYYLSRELLRRGAKVSWIQLRRETKGVHEGIEFVKVRAFGPGLLHSWITLLGVLAFCKSRKVSCVYADDWLLFRDNPLRLLTLQMVLQLARVNFVFDQRDPYIDYEIACKRLVPGSRKYRKLGIIYKLINHLSALILLPSSAYAQVLVREQGIDPRKVFGTLRGVDRRSFHPNLAQGKLRKQLNLEGKFVVGWYGWVGPFRQIREVFVPLIQKMKDLIPNGHVLVAGDGDQELLDALSRLNKEGYPVTVLDFQPYESVPHFIQSCDVLICPLDDSSVHTRNTISLKILESLAVGKPVIATRTRAQQEDLKELKGISWVGADFESFAKALVLLNKEYDSYARIALEQALAFGKYSIDLTIPRIVSRMLEAIIEDERKKRKPRSGFFSISCGSR